MNKTEAIEASNKINHHFSSHNDDLNNPTIKKDLAKTIQELIGYVDNYQPQTTESASVRGVLEDHLKMVTDASKDQTVIDNLAWHRDVHRFISA
ncbi:MAG: hypothetical protein KME15_26450 [Drouetiella hepatica Uher 2000/2452]|jgi:hypothetical protein|uniref:Uncharacterized protein n=1 Tax=Drouetiella hepatica Uher 2000/2452 TaxID=904376 RepID=A0A951UQQ7_9CYAN|nr:hypothetical protein [Drouetiella hepatica Uher 2000/2452]